MANIYKQLQKRDKMFRPKNILVTGAAGFIGCNFVRYMLSRYPDIKIISFDKLTYAGNIENLSDVLHLPNHHFVKGDICDQALVLKTLREFEVDTIVHFAAESHVDNSIAGPEVFVTTNVLGTFHLLEAARRYWQAEKGWGEHKCRFHHISTDEVYGTLTKEESAFTEETKYAPNSPYSASKAGSDHLVRAYYHTYKLPVTTSNCSNNYGPYQHPEKLIPTVIRCCIEQKPIPVYGDGSNIRDWLYVEDHVAAIDLILRKGKVSEVYNIGGENEVDNLTLVKRICQLMDEVKPELAPHESLITFVEDRKGHDWRYAIDASKVKEELSWEPSQKFTDMLKQTLNFYRKMYGNSIDKLA